MAVITRLFENVSAVTAGTELEDILGLAAPLRSGYLRQVIVTKQSGGATTIDVQVRYETADADRTNLVYFNNDATFPLTDSAIDAPFSCRNPAQPNNLILYLEPNANCVVHVRLDFDIT